MVRPLCLLLIGLIATLTPAADEAPRFRKTLKLADKLFIVAESPDEPHSTGSFSVRAYQRSTDEYLDGRFGTREGTLTEAWATNLDGDDQIDVVIWIQSVGSGSHGELIAFTLTEKETLRPLEIHAPDDALLEGYRGHDTYELINQILYRSFPRYLDDDTNAQPTGGRMRLQYDAAKRRWNTVVPLS